MYADRLKEIRKNLHYTVKEIANVLGIKERTYGSWEREEKTPSMELGTLLCQKLNVNLNWFCTGEGKMFNPIKTDKDELRQIFSEIIEDEFAKRGL